MSNIVNPLFFQPSDINGIPLSGAKLFFYSTGTDTLATVYQDANLTTPHTNPVIADASGIFPTIYQGKLALKVRLETALGVTVRTVDPFTNVEAMIASVLASSSTNYPTRAAIQAADIDPLINFISADGYAAVGDNGGADYVSVANTGPLQPYQVQSDGGGRRWQIASTAVLPEMVGNNVADAFTTGQALLIPVMLRPFTTYTYAAQITISQPLSVVSFGNSTLEYTGLTGDGIVITALSDVSFDRVTFMGPSAALAATSTAGSMVYVNPPTGNGTYRPKFKDCNFEYGFNQLVLGAAFEWSVHGCNFNGPKNASLLISNTLNPGLARSTCVSCKFIGTSDTAIGIFHSSGSNIWFENLYFTNLASGYICTLGTGVSIYDLWFVDCQVSNMVTGFFFQKGAGVRLANVIFEGCHLYAKFGLLTDAVPGWFGNLTVNGCQVFPLTDGTGINICANPFVLTGNTYDGGGPIPGSPALPGTTGLQIMAGSFNGLVQGNVFTTLIAPFNDGTGGEQSITVIDNPGLENLTPAVGGTMTGSPFVPTVVGRRVTYYITIPSGSGYGISINGIPVATGTGTGSILSFPLGPRKALSMTYTGTPPSWVAVTN